jgi:large subunit ribosomal protein L9
MKIILQKPVENLGVPGDIVEVADGYARNFLVPRGLAIRAARGSLVHAETMTKAHLSRQIRQKVEFEAMASRLISAQVTIMARAGEEGKLFGSVTADQIAEAIRIQADIPVDKKDVHVDEPIRSLGNHEVKVHLFAEVDPILTIQVVAES